MDNLPRLQVLLHETPIGALSLTRSVSAEFRLFESYKHSYPRPVLGQLFLDDLDQVHLSRQRTPAWFSNLLPEGPLRELIAKRAGVSIQREFFLLHHLGEDLPGAVRILSEEALSEPTDIASEMLRKPPDEEWHFSLAGVQLKFSAVREDRGLTIPISGTGGDWIVKLPDARYPKVPENEYATMRWAQASGIEIPEILLIPVKDISGLPHEIGNFQDKKALAVRRFDRTSTGVRIHMEDFAQILGVYPEQKYDACNYETLANLILSLVGEDGLDEFIRRLVFVIASGNGDAHIKNWSLIYPDGINAMLSPAYDLVSIVQYKEDDRLALNLAKSKRWEDISRESFLRLARKIGYDEKSMGARVDTALEKTMDAWNHNWVNFGYDKHAYDCMLRHLKRVPLFATSVKCALSPRLKQPLPQPEICPQNPII
ncbi:MAG: type II toxin-antitoxin system HipA family toxin [Sulfuricellaceae bacterium]